ncbi:MAG: exosome complex RNA-binding protein Rrp4 [Candidatus Aenigmarchaeota archaeon]|nr:exosome complex RNA-binding protein Rrp4 [Candidatus Aenigmarchaeota archaeon]MDW8159978.1 exosome complex RNA-binding protein Rrp4 [Candidatus Aenigmarchaeota archaeon]
MQTRDIVLPGMYIEERKGRKLNNCYSEGEKVYSKVLGILKISEEEISVIPLAGKYIPKVGDRVVGVIDEVEVSGWWVDINSPYKAFLPIGEALEEFVDLKKVDLSRFYDIGDVIFCKISKVTKNKIVQVSMKDMIARKLFGGAIMKITPFKVPRVIGKGGSMIELIKSKTKTEIYVGQNGLIWVKGGKKEKAWECISTIEKEAHTSGLTEKISKMLEG